MLARQTGHVAVRPVRRDASMTCHAAQAIWFSASKDLSEDARRDFRDIGALKYGPVRIHNLRSVLSKAQWGALSRAPGDQPLAWSNPESMSCHEPC